MRGIHGHLLWVHVLGRGQIPRGLGISTLISALLRGLVGRTPPPSPPMKCKEGPWEGPIWPRPPGWLQKAPKCPMCTRRCFQSHIWSKLVTGENRSLPKVARASSEREIEPPITKIVKMQFWWISQPTSWWSVPYLWLCATSQAQSIELTFSRKRFSFFIFLSSQGAQLRYDPQNFYHYGNLDF